MKSFPWGWLQNFEIPMGGDRAVSVSSFDGVNVVQGGHRKCNELGYEQNQ